MPNAIKTLNDGDITREALRILKNGNSILKNVDRQYDEDFGKPGRKNAGQLLIRLPNRYTTGTGRTITPQDTQERTTRLVTGTQRHVPVQFFSDELTLSLDDFSKRILRPAMSILASMVALDVALAMAKGFAHVVGTPGTTPSSFALYGAAGEMLDWQTAPRDGGRVVMLNPTHMAATVDANKGLFAPSDRIGDQYESGIVEKMTGFRFDMDQSLPTIVNGDRTGRQTNQASSTNGDTTLTIGSGSGTIKAGEMFTIAGVYEVNPDTKLSTGRLKVFTAAADGTTSITLSDPIFKTGPHQNFYHSGGDIPNTTALTMIGSASTGYSRSFAYHESAVALATADLEVPKGTDMAYRARMDGLSLRFIRDYDTINDNWIGRFDVYYGILVTRPQWGVQIIGA